jgi:hypothetical protein
MSPGFQPFVEFSFDFVKVLKALLLLMATGLSSLYKVAAHFYKEACSFSP